MIKKWHLKAVIQKGITFLPFKTRVNYFFQKLLGNVELSDQMFRFKITHAGDHIDFFNELSKAEKSLALELGTGWYPIVPISLYLSGFDKIISVDINKWLTRENVTTTIEKFIEWEKDGKLQEHLPEIQPERWEHLVHLLHREESSLKELCHSFNFHPKIADARDLSFVNNQSVDLICSNNTFEHLDPAIFPSILNEFKRLIKPGGIMSHFIDMSDHYAHFDASITHYNFLKYSDAQWRLIDNSLGYQNRLRFEDYKALYKSAGINFEERKIVPGQPEEINRDKLAEKFSNYSTESLAITHGYLVSSFN